MKKHFLLIVLVILAISSLMGGCSTLAPETPMLPSETTYPVSDPTSTSMKSARFTIQAGRRVCQTDFCVIPSIV